MGKVEVRRFNELMEIDESEKDILLKELSNSVHNYIRTGVENRQLDELIELEEAFREKYEKRFDVEDIINEIFLASQSLKLEALEDLKLGNVQSTGNINISEKLLKDKTLMQIKEEFSEIIQFHLQKVLRDAAYLSHINMLYELYEQEKIIRKKEIEYENLSKKYHKMADIAKNLSAGIRMEMDQLQDSVDISQIELEELLTCYSKYFNIRRKKENIQVSLSPDGRRYYNYIISSKEKYSKGALEQLVYKNCDKLMEFLDNSYDRGVELELKLDEITPEINRALQTKYHKIMQKILTEYQENYTSNWHIIKEGKESVNRDNEENRIKIPRTWDIESHCII